MKKILLFQIERPILVKQAVATMGLRVETVPVERFGQTIGEILSGPMMSTESVPRELPTGSLLMMCELTQTQIEEVLSRLRRNHVKTTYKAILTPTNLNWTVIQVYEEMERERKAWEQQNNS